jgi:hypothetical protein
MYKESIIVKIRKIFADKMTKEAPSPFFREEPACIYCGFFFVSINNSAKY